MIHLVAGVACQINVEERRTDTMRGIKMPTFEKPARETKVFLFVIHTVSERHVSDIKHTHENNIKLFGTRFLF